ncbi:hypothetical protein RhiirA4_454837 [Rhizophagus irregularis]|uniref:Uncharacterized protein n=1 Tax=Rhizophagus irregularis TaxID=588596 RepID=A0A2I1G3Y6_9GLOM|nr:hypothetical protein RhiirA4_454837 [Rhizophagus irregularis]
MSNNDTQTCAFDSNECNNKRIYKKKVQKFAVDDNIMEIGTHTYALRSNILYTQTELKQLELDY